MLLRLLLPEFAAPVLDRFAGAAMSTDWGVRMLSNTSALYDAVSYNNGTVWPFLNGNVSWAEYRNHRPVSAFLHWAQGARLTSNNALGYMPELLSGDYYIALDTAVPHQLFSSAGVLTPLLKGMLGFYPSAKEKVVELQPHLPARWDEVKVNNLRVGQGAFSFTARRDSADLVYDIDSSGLEGFVLKLSAGLEPGAIVKGAQVNGKAVKPAVQEGEDVHCELEARLSGKDEIRISLVPGLRIMEPLEPAAIGERPRQLKIVRVRWDRGSACYTLDLEGRSGVSSRLQISLPARPAAVEGAAWSGTAESGSLQISFPSSAAEYSARTVRVMLR
jgi:hypothetical protein